MYKYACIEEASIGGTIPQTYSKGGWHIYYWNDEDHAFDYNLGQWGV